MERQQCKTCLYSEKNAKQEPCCFCEYDEDTDSFSMFQPVKKDLNQLLRERIEASKNGEGIGHLYGFRTYTAPPLEDAVKQPSHYMLKPGLEVRDVIKLLVGKMHHYTPMFVADYVQASQYMMRFMSKNGKEDLLKARWFIDKLIEEYDE